MNPASGTVAERIHTTVRVGWARAPQSRTTVPTKVTGAGRTVVVQVVVDKPGRTTPLKGFVEASGYVSMEAEYYTNAVAGSQGNRFV